MTTPLDADQQRLRYANELAEYTRRQWDIARQSLEHSRSQPQVKTQQNGVSRTSPLKDNSHASQGQVTLDDTYHEILDYEHYCRHTVSRLCAALSQAWRKHGA